MSTNISKQKRDDLLNKIQEIRTYIATAEQDDNTARLLTFLSDLAKDVNGKKYGLVFEEHREEIDEILDTHAPVLTEDNDLFIDNGGQINCIIESDNYGALRILQKTHRGKIDLIYIDPPFDSKADYKKRIELKGKEILNDANVFEEKQYGDIWTNDEYLQFMYERLVLLRELLSDNGTIYLHCDYHKHHHLRCLMDEVFGPKNFINEIIWNYGGPAKTETYYPRKYDTIISYAKSCEYKFFKQTEPIPQYMYDRARQDPDGRKWVDQNLGKLSDEKIAQMKEEGRIFVTKTGNLRRKQYLDEMEGVLLNSVWGDIPIINSQAIERADYPTQKPLELLKRIIKTSTSENDLVFDCFMGSGTTQVAALETGRRFIGADINLGAVQTTTKRIISTLTSNVLSSGSAGFEVFNVNNYDFFRNPIEAKDILIEALNIQKFPSTNVFDGELDGRHIKILPVNRIATKADLNELVSNLPYKLYEKAREENPNDDVDKITLVCMGHEPDLSGALKQMIGNYKVDVQVVDILKDKSDLEFKREAEADIKIKGNKLIISDFFPMNLLQKLSLQKENVDEWQQLVESVMIDYNYDGKVLNPQIIDIPEKNNLVKGEYNIPSNHGVIKVKITDLLSESLEIEVK